MGQTTIEWTDFTFNPWHGCVRVSPGCKNCYAEAFDRRTHGTARHLDSKGNVREPHWGADAPRRFFGDKHWNEPLKWDRDAAEAAGVRRRVFCASMADVFEDRPDLVEPRARLFSLIQETQALDWLLLTKRPENIDRLLTPWILEHIEGPLTNVWLGTTVEDQERADERIPHLLTVPAAVRFLSVEPLLGPVDLAGRLGGSDYLGDRHDDAPGEAGIDWVIVGGESGANARPCPVDAIRSVVDQCAAGGVPCFVKQLGTRVWVDFYADEPLAEWSRERERCVWDSDGMGKVGGIEAVCKWHPRDGQPRAGAVIEVALRSRKGADPAEWPEDLRVRQWPRIRTCWEKVK